MAFASTAGIQHLVTVYEDSLQDPWTQQGFFSCISEQKHIKCYVIGDSGTNKLRHLGKTCKTEKFHLDANFTQLLVNNKQLEKAPKALAELSRKTCNDQLVTTALDTRGVKWHLFYLLALLI